MTFETGESARRVLSAGFWRAQVAGWLILLVLGFCIRLVVFGNIEASLWLTLVIEPLAFALTSAAAIWHVRHAPRGIPLPIVLPCVVMLCAAAAALLAAIGQTVYGLFDLGELTITRGHQFRLGVIYYMGILSIWTLIYFGVEAELAARNERISKMKAETRAVQIELEHLQTQIEPHFLFNALNTLVAEIPERPHIAEEMTRRLADYLRYSLGNRGDGMCRMSEELAAAEYYIRIQELRFDKRLAYQSQVDPSTLSALIPHMTLQGLIENAIKHGHWNDDEPFLINLRVARLHESLIIEVDNPGQLHTSQVRDRYGLGLSNLCRRLDLHYPGRNEFSLIQTAGRTVARLTLHGEPASL
ncbi:histidine kinase [Pusillimonas sp. MFBS29]|uniref:sensor histidine kinase n=1 Tax=Pusillimonas sp. MFBS29 TaxID=2886690 RepID=UPI001D0FFEFF|nr:histidine kinase [Pusillimonas sp. MFBS29]MCC2597133.1 histidine kinase [Pusillimonas sp. MFBS29]